MKPDQHISSFIAENNLFTIATSNLDIPYTAICFYYYSEEFNAIVFKSDLNTRHIRESIENNKVAGSIVPERKMRGKVQGIQFQGIIANISLGKEWAKDRNNYYQKYPHALLMKGAFWSIELIYIKMTDNNFGIGKKLEWNKQAENLDF